MNTDETRMKREEAALESWKEIGAYLQRDGRTAQRWGEGRRAADPPTQP